MCSTATYIVKKHWLFIFGLSAVIFCSCGNRDIELSRPECDVVVRINLDINNLQQKRVLPDPGTDHGELCDTVWDELVLFFVYQNGNTNWHAVSRKDFYENELEPDGCRSLRISLFEGTLTDIYAIAFAAPHSSAGLKQNYTPDEIKNLRTLSLDDRTCFPDLNGAGSEGKNYMLSLFSGIDSNSHELKADADLTEHIHVRLTRLVAKIDVQYDLDEAYENGKFVKPAMSGIQFSGMSQGWFFPSLADMSVVPEQYVRTVGSNISERNGRMAVYAFPGERNGFIFSVDFGGDIGSNRYNAVFDEPLGQSSWHKVNFNVTGTTASVGGSHDITLKQ